MKGPVRLGIFLTAIWLVTLTSVAIGEYRNRNVFCMFPEATAGIDPVCEHHFWAWKSQPDKMLAITPRFERMIFAGVGIPMAAWAFGFGIVWVVRGFRQGNAT